MSRTRRRGSKSATATETAPFDEVMDAEAPVDHEVLRHSAARVVRAHKYFTEAVAEWLNADAERAGERARAPTGVPDPRVAPRRDQPDGERELAGDLRNRERTGHASHRVGPHQELRVPAAVP